MPRNRGSLRIEEIRRELSFRSSLSGCISELKQIPPRDYENFLMRLKPKQVIRNRTNLVHMAFSDNMVFPATQSRSGIALEILFTDSRNVGQRICRKLYSIGAIHA